MQRQKRDKMENLTAKEHMQTKAFTEYSSDNEPALNDFLKEIGTRVVSVTPLWNTIMGGINYIVVYWC